MNRCMDTKKINEQQCISRLKWCQPAIETTVRVARGMTPKGGMAYEDPCLRGMLANPNPNEGDFWVFFFTGTSVFARSWVANPSGRTVFPFTFFFSSHWHSCYSRSLANLYSCICCDHVSPTSIPQTPHRCWKEKKKKQKKKRPHSLLPRSTSKSYFRLARSSHNTSAAWPTSIACSFTARVRAAALPSAPARLRWRSGCARMRATRAARSTSARDAAGLTSSRE